LWNALEYVTLFGIVLLHEMGHALACRQVGGQANLIVLWPLGGVAYVSPPPRPGATLWSIAAGPLVNVALLPVLYFLWKVMPDGCRWQLPPMWPGIFARSFTSTAAC
jgi:Zn-dependent protease